MFGYLAAGISWVLMDVAGDLLQRLAPQNQLLRLSAEEVHRARASFCC